MKLYENLKYLTNYKISQNELSKLTGIAQSTMNENLKNNREFKGTQIYKIAKVLIEKKIITSIDELFEKDLSK